LYIKPDFRPLVRRYFEATAFQQTCERVFRYAGMRGAPKNDWGDVGVLSLNANPPDMQVNEACLYIF